VLFPLALVVATIGGVVAVDPAGWRDDAPATPKIEVSTASINAGTPAAATGAAGQSCLSQERAAQAKVHRVTGAVRTFRVNAVPDGQTYDLRGASVIGYPAVNRYPLMMGKYGPGTGTCVVGGRVAGHQPRHLDWHQMKGRVDGDGLNIKARGGVVTGTRIDNVEDGIATTGIDPGGISISDVYMTYIRDDCIENDWIVNVTVRDSLFDGCYTAISQRPDPEMNPQPAPPDERFTLDGVLMRLQPMPYKRARSRCPANVAGDLGNGGFFKWSPWASHLVVRDSVLLAERASVNCKRVMDFPTNAEYHNVTLIWLGPGDYPGRLPASGVTVTRDRGIWDRARADWLTRHGYPVTP
jgi:hypothetical protein